MPSTATESFRVRLRRGESGENLIASFLLARGSCVLPVCDSGGARGKGPRLLTPTRGLVSPDLLAFADDGRVTWIECKLKGKFSWHRNTKQWTTGVDARYFEHYLEIGGTTGVPVWLLFLHLDASFDPQAGLSPVGLFGGNAAKLAKCIHHRHERGGRNGEPMLYWSAGSLTKLATVEQLRELETGEESE